MVQRLWLLMFTLVLGCQQQDVNFSPIQPEVLKPKGESEPNRRAELAEWELFYPEFTNLEDQLFADILPELSFEQKSQISVYFEDQRYHSIPAEFFNRSYKYEVIKYQKSVKPYDILVVLDESKQFVSIANRFRLAINHWLMSIPDLDSHIGYTSTENTELTNIGTPKNPYFWSLSELISSIEDDGVYSGGLNSLTESPACKPTRFVFESQNKRVCVSEESYPLTSMVRAVQSLKEGGRFFRPDSEKIFLIFSATDESRFKPTYMGEVYASLKLLNEFGQGLTHFVAWSAKGEPCKQQVFGNTLSESAAVDSLVSQWPEARFNSVCKLSYNDEMLRLNKLLVANQWPKTLELKVGHLPVKWVITPQGFLNHWRQDENKLYLEQKRPINQEFVVIYENQAETARYIGIE